MSRDIDSSLGWIFAAGRACSKLSTTCFLLAIDQTSPSFPQPTMISAISGFLNRHKRKFIVAAGVVASGYLAVDYLKTKFFELQDRLATERAAKENLRRRFEQNQQDATFTIMALLPGLSQDVLEKYQVENITKELQAKRTERVVRGPLSDAGVSDISNLTGPTEATSGENGGGDELTESGISIRGTESSTLEVNVKPKKSKTQLWQDLKIQSLTRLFTLVYSSALLVFFTRLQLNILGRKNYVASVVQLAGHQDSNNGEITMEDSSGYLPEHVNNTEEEEEEAQINRMYLTFSWWLLNKGWESLSEQVEVAVVKVFDTINPRADLSLAELSELIGQVQYLIDFPESSKESQNFLTILLPPPELESYLLAQTIYADSGDTPDEVLAKGSPLRDLLDETADFIESPNASEVIKRLVHTGLAVAVNKISTMYPQSDPGAGFVTSPRPSSTNLVSPSGNPTSPAAEDVLFLPRVKLASILANITRQAPQIGQGTPFEPNEYVTAMTQVNDLDAFSAVVYSNFDWRKLDQD